MGAPRTAVVNRQVCEVQIPVGNILLDGDLVIPEGAKGLVLFAHGSGSSRLSPRNQFVAGIISEAGIGTLLFDLLTREEEFDDFYTKRLRFDIDLLAFRLAAATAWVANRASTRGLRLGYFGASTGAAAAVLAASTAPKTIGAIVSRGGRPDLAGDALEHVRAPTLFIVGGNDLEVLELNFQALAKLHCVKEMKIVPRATHLFEEPGALENVAQLASEWFKTHLSDIRVGARKTDDL
jgi:dienelactone hydrolase